MCCVIAAYCFEVSRDFLVTETNDEVEFKIKRDLSVSEVWLWLYEVIALELRSQVRARAVHEVHSSKLRSDRTRNLV